jgi:hypothetical protein
MKHPQFRGTIAPRCKDSYNRSPGGLGRLEPSVGSPRTRTTFASGEVRMKPGFIRAFSTPRIDTTPISPGRMM